MKSACFFVYRKKTVLVLVLMLLLLIGGTFFGIRVSQAGSPKTGTCVVLDAGHGGIDGGKTGVVTKTPEAVINLAIVKILADSFEHAGIRAVLTRKTSAGLYGNVTSNYKKADMKARAEIINRAQPALMISIHQNSYVRPGTRGAHVFYQKDGAASLRFAQSVQMQLNGALPATARVPQVGDFFVLNCTKSPAILVECGFLSNAEDERNLLKPAYREKVAHHIFLGAMRVLSGTKKVN